MGCTYTQHLSHFNNIGRYGCPRAAILKGIADLIKKWKEDSKQVILMGNINKNIKSSNIKKFFNDLDMQELTKERHIPSGPATTKGKTTQ
eukprot:4520089-Ditylum_brightwellii.AAC.1